jgi:hypothetical protein
MQPARTGTRRDRNLSDQNERSDTAALRNA